MGKAISWTTQEVEKVLGEVLDKNKIQLICELHHYLGSSTPPQPIGCKHCWEAYYWHMIASTPPHLRAERLDQLSKSVQDACRMADRGEFDFEPFARPEITVQKDGWDDATSSLVSKRDTPFGKN